MNIQFLLLLFVLLRSAISTNCVVYLREKNERGPAAWRSGVNCLYNVTAYYFYDPLPTRTKNSVILHTKNLSSPAYEIERLFLQSLHNHIADGHSQVQGHQIRIISDNYKIDGMKKVQANLITLTDFYVIVADHFEKLYENMRKFVTQAAAWNPSAKFVILFNNLDIRQPGVFPKQIFRMMKVKFHVTNVIILFGNGVAPYMIMKSDPFAGATCRDIEVTVIGTCHDGLIRDDAKVQNILKLPITQFNLENCNFHFCAQVTPPFIDEGCKSGLEIELIKTIKTAMKFKVDTFCTTVERGSHFPNGTITGLLEMIMTGQCDFLAGGFFPDDEVHKAFDVTQTYFQDSYTWFVPLAMNRPHWEGLIKIFETQTWLVFAFILLVSGLAWFSFGLFPPEDVHHRYFALSFLNSLSVFLGVSSNNRPIQFPLKVFFITLSLYGLNVTTLYTSHLIAVFTHETKLDQIDSMEEIIEAQLPFGGREEYQDWFENEGDQHILLRYNSSALYLPTDENLDRVRMGYQAILANRLYVMTNPLREKIFGLTSNIFSNQLEMITLKGFPLLSRWNTLISLFKDAGLVDKILHDFSYRISTLNEIRDIVNGDVDDNENGIGYFFCAFIFNCKSLYMLINILFQIKLF